jgi:O-antigen ligase
MQTLKRLDLPRIERILWAALLVALPVTSFRYLPMGSGTQVRPLSLVPAGFLILVLAVHCLRDRSFFLWNKAFTPLLVFILIAAVASLVGYLYAPIDVYSFTYPSRVLRAWVAFAVGLVFLLTAVAMNRSEEDLKFTIKWLYIGLVAEVAWSLVQVVGIYVIKMPGLDAFQKTIMMAGLPPNKRISGLALEPSWLAAQVMALYLPWAFASLVKNYHWNKWRWLPIVILAACAFLLLFSFSRAGILFTAAAIVLTFIFAGWDQIRQVWTWFISPWRPGVKVPRKWLEILLRLVLVGAVLAVSAGGLIVLSHNHYFASLWQSKQTSLVDYFVGIYAGPRLAYMVAGWNIFSQHPFSGVGLGADGFYLVNAMPDWAHFNISELAQIFSPSIQTFPNVNNLYVRLLTDTGIFGFWAFLSFYLLILGKIITFLRSKKKEILFLGAAGLFAWFAIVMLGFTQDSLAMPVVWVPLGIIIGMAGVTSE